MQRKPRVESDDAAGTWAWMPLIVLVAAALCQDVVSATSRAAEPSPNIEARSASDRDMVLWHGQPSTNWLQAMPLGNGMIGAMVFGGVGEERIALNESSFWSGRPHNYDNPEAFEYFPRIRDLVFAGEFQEAERMVNDRFYGRPKPQEAYHA